MEKRAFGSTGLEVTVLGLGAAEIGYEGAGTVTVDRIIGTALDSGMNVIDTAECYVTSEENIGKTASKRRDEFYLFTKCGHPDGSGSENWSKDSILWSIERSLRRLQTERLDLVQLHSCSEEVLRRGEVIEALQEAREKHYTRFIGYSGDSADALYAVRTGAFDTLQISVNVADQESIEKVLPEAASRKMGVIAKRPVANAAWKTGKKPGNEYAHAYWNRFQQLKYPFLGLPVPESVGTALRFTLSQPGVCTAIVGTTKPERIVENIKQLGGRAEDEEVFRQIRDIWKKTATDQWVGQV